MAAAGENYARLWMVPWAFGIENPSDPLTRYRLNRAWQLDHVFNLAEQHGIYLMLCFDYQLQQSTNLISWEPAQTPSSPHPPWEMGRENKQGCFRAVQSHPY